MVGSFICSACDTPLQTGYAETSEPGAGANPPAPLQLQRSGSTATLLLQGPWVAARAQQIRAALNAADLAGVTHLTLDAHAAQPLDLAGGWLLHHYLRSTACASLTVDFASGVPDSLRVVRQTLADSTPHDLDDKHGDDPNPVAIIGKRALVRLQALRQGLAFVGQVAVTLARACRSLRRFRVTSIVRHVWDTGITAVPIVSLIAFLISVIIAYLSASQLRAFGADIFVVDLITVGVLRELGVLLTAIIVAGRSGSAFAAEIGAMKLNEEVDALDAAGVDATETLILPRIVGLTIALPLLTVIADMVGLAGGALLCHELLDMPLQQFINRAAGAIAPTTFWVGIWTAPVFAILIGLSGCYRGLQVRGSSRDLGRLTTSAVVQSIFLVLLADALFAILFMEIDV